MKNASIAKIGAIYLFLIMATLCGRAEDWMVKGRTFQNVTVGKIEADRVHITYNGGIGTVMLADLPPELQKRFNYDPAAAAAATQAEQKQEAASDNARIATAKAEAQKAEAKQAQQQEQTQTATAQQQVDPKRLAYIAALKLQIQTLRMNAVQAEQSAQASAPGFTPGHSRKAQDDLAQAAVLERQLRDMGVDVPAQ